MSSEQEPIAASEARAAPDPLGAGVLRDVTLRVWAELGRAHLPVGRAAGLGPGAVIELDRDVDEPVGVYANGRRIGTGRLLLIEQGEWAVQLEQVSPSVVAESER
ncbi:MAG TPA: FliM/FliN family flagellar motor switch protein [Gaiellales bacterium]|jgi:flagellar motor switch protein FliN/FliY|nr:FliM/FliN family flagellar motor switch protein [Gaiellales bacterium]